MKLALTLLVRDEADIIVANLEHHLTAGVDHVYVTDNLSEDETRDLVSPYERAGVATVIDEHDDDYAQAKWVTRMALRAHRDGADWVINGDADEFWWAGESGSSLAVELGRLPFHVGVVAVERFDYPPVEPERGGPFWQRMVYRKAESRNALGRPLPPKVAHRATAHVSVAQGNHAVEGLEDRATVTAGTIEILHFPIRDERQFTRKIVNGGRAYARNRELDRGIGSTWRTLYAEYLDEGLGRRYRQEAVHADRLDRQLADGRLRFDPRLRDRLEALGGPWR